MTIMSFLATSLTVLLLLAPVLYILMNSVLPAVLGVQDLKKKYGATWALVTGGSSGIGKEIVRKLLQQGFSVVIIARDEPLFDETIQEFEQFIAADCKTTGITLAIRKVCANLADGTGVWMSDVKAATQDIDIQVVFNNAGFILTGFFEQHSLESQLANFHCNLTANVHLTHHFYGKMISKGLRGCIVYTSSSAGFIPNPFAALYGCTKAAVSELAASLAVEGKSRGIDVHAVHPSPVNSRFLAGGGNDVKVHKVDAISMAYKFASGPEALPDKIFSAIGRTPVMIDLGSTSVIMRLAVHFIGYNLMTYVFALFAPLMPDFKRNMTKQA